MYGTILLPVDGGAPAEAATDHAIELATSVGAALHVVYVVDVPALQTYRMAADETIEAYREEGEGIVEAVEERANAAGVDIETTILEGSPAAEIVALADDVDADVIVMGTHGRRGVERYVLGSVTEKVLRQTDRPVLAVSLPAEQTG